MSNFLHIHPIGVVLLLKSELHNVEELAPDKPHGISCYRELIEFVRDRPGHVARCAIDASKIHRDLGRIPEETFETGLLKTI